ncbi:PREDICTED: uncharacterized protein LOC107161552 [Diuraphis noxia]|uniref:uncharacterized protein LOC107161552 n=1 Tax=Diuraphis noxia TaxID=143948 RepID=UPI00076369A6|nr:PREDICTED: uncharacterized protein LOC107161552 [Diuraphis noxia]XP_015363483.1 PREDICTED: uncharacterized protein LOC107161552 [Diuraphis noxia]
MDILYPCSMCPKTFTLRKHILKHIKTVHESNVPSMCYDDSKSLLNCSQCHKQFNSQNLLNKHINLNHNISISNLNENTSRPLEKRVSQKLNAYSSLKDCLPVNYSYKILAFKDLSFGQFKAKFHIVNIDKESFLDWLNSLCHKTKVNYITENVSSISLKNIYRIVYKCKNIDYWNVKSNSMLQNPTSCKASLTVMIKPLNNELPHKSKAVILMKHCHCHPMNCLTSMNLSHEIYDVYNQIIFLLKNGKSAAGALHEYTIKTIQNKGKNHYLKLMDSGVKPDVEFVYELYYRHMRKSRFSSPYVKRVESLMKSIKYYNASIGTKCALIQLIKNNIVITIRTPLMGTINTDTVYVCSTSFDICKTWFMFSKNDRKIMIPIGVIISTEDKDCLLNAGLCSWEKLGGTFKTIVVDLVYIHTFKTVFPKATVCVSKFHFLLTVWKWLISITNKNNLIEELNCFVEFKKIVCSTSFIADHLIDTNFDIFVEKYPNFKQFMQNIDKNILFCSPMASHPCFTISERKLIYYHTKSLSILQTFHFVIDEIDFFYNNLPIHNPNNDQQIILNYFKEMYRDKNCFTYCSIDDDHSMYLVENDNADEFFVDMDIGVCSCTVNNVCSPCVHQVFLSERLNEKANNCSAHSTCVLNTSNYDTEELNIENKEFENILSEFQSVHNKIKEQFMIDPEYFKVGIQRFVSTWKNNLISDKSLFLACHSLNNLHHSNLNKDDLYNHDS